MLKARIKKRLIGFAENFQLDIDIELNTAEFVTLFGKSGSGKTTFLRILSGLTEPDEGIIEINGETWFNSEKNINLPAQKRKIGYIFQDYALFPNMTVRENLEFALEGKIKNKATENLIDELLDKVHLLDLQDRKPETLSGGQKQRVAFARALVRKPSILLMDEPLSALDVELRTKLQDEILQIQKEFKFMAVLVSHDMAEVFKLSERVFILEKGSITHSGKAFDVFLKEKMSGDFQFYAELLDIQKADVIYILTVSIGNQVVKIVAVDNELNDLKIGDRVILSTKSFNPLITKIS